MRKTICFDFDGVINSYGSGWLGPDVIPDPPVPGICDEIRKLRNKGYEIVVQTTRASNEDGLMAVIKYLDGIGIGDCVDAVTAVKPPAVCYVDDRAIRFDGKAEGLSNKVMSFRAWWEKEDKNE